VFICHISTLCLVFGSYCGVMHKRVWLLAVVHRTVKNAKQHIPFTANFSILWSAVRKTSSLKDPIKCMT